MRTGGEKAEGQAWFRQDPADLKKSLDGGSIIASHVQLCAALEREADVLGVQYAYFAPSMGGSQWRPTFLMC
jgi:hypothetical protein